jgi:hypothetical protein
MKLAYFLPSVLALAGADAGPPPPPDPVYDSLRPHGDFPSNFTLYGITYGGSGCPQGSLDTSKQRISPLGASLDYNFTAQSGRTNCQILFDVLYDEGYQFSVFASEVHGHGWLDNGTTATIQDTIYFSGSSDQVRFVALSQTSLVTSAEFSVQQSASATISGPFVGRVTELFDYSATEVWSPCGEEGLVNSNTAVRLSGGSGTITLSKDENRYTQSLYFKWRKC